MGADFSKSLFVGSKLIAGAGGFQQANFQHSDCQGAVFSSASGSWNNADFSYADLRGAVLTTNAPGCWEQATFEKTRISETTRFWDGNIFKSTSFDWKRAGMIIIADTAAADQSDPATTNSTISAIENSSADNLDLGSLIAGVICSVLGISAAGGATYYFKCFQNCAGRDIVINNNYVTPNQES